MGLGDFHARLHAWYSTSGRHSLPWRNTSDPYAIYLSEIMLQQTQVQTVLERFYFPFLARFPTLQSLAEAEEQEVLSAWQGLGYYTRARNLHKAAQASGGVLPDSVEELMELPGIGRNTAHAIAAFAYHQPVAVMEANVRRVVSRIFALKDASEAELFDKAAQLLDRRNPFDYNQAMMDIGALVCKKQAPLCGECPANSICQGKISPQDYPQAKRKKTPPVRCRTIIVLQNQKGHYYATPRTTRFLHGLYHFIELESKITTFQHAGNNYRLDRPHFLGHIRQQYSHFTLEAEVFLLTVQGAGDKHWYDATSLRALPFSKAEEKICALLPMLTN